MLCVRADDLLSPPSRSMTIDGYETNGYVKGINIVKMSDGTTKKITVKKP